MQVGYFSGKVELLNQFFRNLQTSNTRREGSSPCFEISNEYWHYYIFWGEEWFWIKPPKKVANCKSKEKKKEK